MKSSRKISAAAVQVVLLFGIMFYAGCDEDNAWGTADSKAGKTLIDLFLMDKFRTFTVIVTVTGYTGSSPLVLQNNGGNDLTILGNGIYFFTTPLKRNETYDVTVLTQPSIPPQTCSTANGTGTIKNNNVTIAFTCAPD